MWPTGEHRNLAPQRGSLELLEAPWRALKFDKVSFSWEKSYFTDGGFIWIYKIYMDVGASFIYAL